MGTSLLFWVMSILTYFPLCLLIIFFM
jgi:hypothetical protein